MQKSLRCSDRLENCTCRGANQRLCWFSNKKGGKRKKTFWPNVIWGLEWIFLHFFVLLLIITPNPYNNIFHTELLICTFNLSPQAPLLFLTGNNKHTSSFNVPLEKWLNTNIYRCLPCLYASSQMLMLNPNAFPCYFLLLGAVQSWFSSGWDLGPVLLIGMGWFQVEGGLKVTAKPVNDWTCSTMQNDMLPSESAGQRERMFSPVTSGEWSLWDLMPLGHPIFTDLFRTSTIAAGSNLDSQFKSYFSTSLFQKLVVLVSLVSNLNHMRKFKLHSGSQKRQTKLVCSFHWLGFFPGVWFWLTKSLYRQGVLQTYSTLRALLTHMVAGCSSRSKWP